MPEPKSEMITRFIGSLGSEDGSDDFAKILIQAVVRSRKHLTTDGQNCDVEVWVLGFLKYCYHVEVQKKEGDHTLFACVACFVCA